MKKEGKAVLFVFLLSTLLLLSPKQFQGMGYGDGFIEYRLAKRMIDDHAMYFAEYESWYGSRVLIGTGGRSFTTYGLGHSFLFALTILADRLVIWLVSLLPGSLTGPVLAEPFFFSKSVNAWVLALTGVCLFTILRDLKISWNISLTTTLLYVFGSMALVYSTLSFDMPLCVLLQIAAFLFLFRAVDRNRLIYWLYSGLYLGLALLTRPLSVILVLPVALYMLLVGTSPGRTGRVWPGGAALFSAALLPFFLFTLYYNFYRFGSIFNTGHLHPDYPGGFDGSLFISLPALLLSPGRSVLFYSPFIVFSLLGIKSFMKADYRKASAVIAAAALNWFLLAMWVYWASPRTWGLRYQLPTIALLFLPLAFWIEKYRAVIFGRFRLVALLACALCVGVQLVPVITGYPYLSFDSRTYWSPDNCQVWIAITNFWKVMSERDWASVRLWWVSPGAHNLQIKLLFLVILAVSAASFVRLCGLAGERRMISRAEGGEPACNGQA